MAILPLTRENFENIVLELHPSRIFSSSSSGVTGSVYVLAERSDFNKEVFKLAAFSDSKNSDSTLEAVRLSLFSNTSSQDIAGEAESYLSSVNQTSVTDRQSKQMEVIRFSPSNDFTSNTLRKAVTKDVLFPFYRTSVPTAHWSFTNYQSLNFFTSSNVPAHSCLAYPSPVQGSTNDYNVTGSFTFSFYVNPRRTVLEVGEDYRAGTILHMSSAFAVSLVTGSHIGQDGRPDKFRIMLQLSSSADTNPSSIDPDTTALQNVYATSDNSLSLNSWHHVAVRWGKDFNSGTGSFFVDGIEDVGSRFDLGLSDINTSVDSYGFNPVIVGNFLDSGVLDVQNRFFNSGVSATEGIYDAGVSPDVQTSSLNNPLNAELHDLRIYSRCLAKGEILSASLYGPENYNDLLFYLPVQFVEESPVRNVLITPFQSSLRSTSVPFNEELSFGVRGKDICAENYLREFVNGRYPRMFYLTSSTVDTSTQTYTADQFLYDISPAASQTRARNLLLLPCDNGLFAPNYSLLSSGSSNRLVNDYGESCLWMVSLNNLISTSSILPGLQQSNADGTDSSDQNGILQESLGSSPEDPSVSPGSGFTILQRTRDNSSNEVVFFDSSNLFYGMRIRPGTMVLTDNSVTASNSRVSITLKDDGSGNVYRADSNTPPAAWSSVGNALYDEGLVVVKSPNLLQFGKEAFEISYEGVHNLHILEMNALAMPGMINSSSNPSFVSAVPSANASDKDTEFTVISGILIHDDNLNVIARANLAQPVVKKQNDKYMFRLKFDF
jgi:hypothetical protein